MKDYSLQGIALRQISGTIGDELSVQWGVRNGERQSLSDY